MENPLNDIILSLEEIQERLECDLYSIKDALRQLRKMKKKEKAIS